MARLPILIVGMLLLSVASTVYLSGAAFATSTGPRLGFWVDERDMWSGVGYAWTPQQFVNNYFLTAPYPAAMLFATGMSPSGPYSPGAMGEAQWLSQVATLAQSDGLNVKIVIIFFVNLSGGTIDGVPDQTTLLKQYMAALGTHPNIYGAEYEREYFGNTVQEVQTFKTIINNAGYVNIDDPTQINNFPSDPMLSYSTYPYYGGVIPAALKSPSIGIGYGEIGVPLTGPVWTQSIVDSIVDKTPTAASSTFGTLVLLYSIRDLNNPAGGSLGHPLWNSPTLRNWIWTASGYQSSYLLSKA